MAPKKTVRRSASRSAEDPRFILDGPDLFIHVDDLIDGLVGFGTTRPVSFAVEGLTLWKNLRITKRKEPR